MIVKTGDLSYCLSFFLNNLHRKIFAGWIKISAIIPSIQQSQKANYNVDYDAISELSEKEEWKKQQFTQV